MASDYSYNCEICNSLNNKYQIDFSTSDVDVYIQVKRALDNFLANYMMDLADEEEGEE